MMKTRASAFEDAPDIDITGFAPKPRSDTTAPPAEKVREVSEAAKFRSREPVPPQAPKAAPKAKREPRRYRTGRNVQFNVKAAQETIDAIYAISDRQKWVLGYTLERALAALERELGTEK